MGAPPAAVLSWGLPGQRVGFWVHLPAGAADGTQGTCALGPLPWGLILPCSHGTLENVLGPQLSLSNVRHPVSLTPFPPPWFLRPDWIRAHPMFLTPPSSPPSPTLFQALALGLPGNSIPPFLGQLSSRPSQRPLLAGWGPLLAELGCPPPHPRPALSCGVISPPRATHS